MAEQNNQQKKGGQQQDANQLIQVRYDKLHELQANGKNPFEITKYDVTHHSTDIKDNFESLEGQEVTVAGRMMFKRVMGKASFCNVQDLKGRIQAYVARDEIGEESYADFKKYDVGDILGIKGKVFKTQTGEISIHAQEVTLLSKSLQILPEKYHGLTDTDARYRQRYVDLIMNEDVKDTFVKRSKVISSIRRYLDGQGFMEVETPMLVSNAGGASARPFETHFNALNEDLKLRISLELYLKRLIVGGMERVYEIGRVFRNEGLDTRHNPEFTLMELYQAYTDYEGMMELTESMFRYLAEKVCGSAKISYNGIEIDLSKPFERLTMNDAIKKYAVWARRELISRVSQRAALYEITDKDYGDASADSVLGRVMSAEEKHQRQALIAQIREKGYEQVMEEIAYTWFNRFIALRFMEVNGYLPSRVRVFTDDENNFKPQILTEAITMELDGLDMEKVYALKNANDDDALFKYMLIVQCNALSSILPGMFQRISDYTELLFPDNLLREGSVIEQMISMIPEEDWKDAVQIIGWLYQYYNSEKKDDVFAMAKFAVDTYGRIDVLVNNAGTMPLAFFSEHEQALDKWEQCIDISIKGTIFGISAVYDQMIKQGQGQVINVSSIYANFPVAGAGVYQVAKMGVQYLAESLRSECQGKIKVTTIKPTGFMKTNLSSSVVDQMAMMPAVAGPLEILSNWVEEAPLRPDFHDINSMTYNDPDPQVLADNIIYAINQPWGVSIGDLTVRASGESFVI